MRGRERRKEVRGPVADHPSRLRTLPKASMQRDRDATRPVQIDPLEAAHAVTILKHFKKGRGLGPSGREEVVGIMTPCYRRGAASGDGANGAASGEGPSGLASGDGGSGVPSGDCGRGIVSGD